MNARPFLFYAVLADAFDTSTPLSRTKYQSSGAPPGTEVMSQDEPAVIARLCDGYAWREFETTSPALATQVKKSRVAMILRGEPVHDAELEFLRTSLGLLSYLLDCGGLAVYDPQTLRWHTRAEWHDKLATHVDPNMHAVILSSEEPRSDHMWLHTRGMRKFGKPDLSVHDVAPNMMEGAVDFCSRMIDHLGRGGTVEDGAPVKMAMLPPGGHVRLQGSLDDPDFNNVHLELVWK